jgi:hypothetical protein
MCPVLQLCALLLLFRISERLRYGKGTCARADKPLTYLRTKLNCTERGWARDANASGI